MKTTSLKEYARNHSNIDALRLTGLPWDTLSADYFATLPEDRQALINACDPNRGDMFETALTGAPTYRTGDHGKSKGDATIDIDGARLLIEVKAVNPKTKASQQAKGTYATHYLIACADRHGITYRLIAKDELITRGNSIAYQDNHDKGREIDLNKVKIHPLW